jgi:HAD superfamily hydrolase (TIGR01509 family)
MLKAVIFDMDGLLVETESICLSVAASKLKEKTGKDMDVIGFVGRRAIDFFSEKFSEEHIKLDINSFILEYRAAYEKELVKNVQELPGAIALINKVKGEYELALVSGSTRKQIDLVLKRLDLSDEFKFIIGNEDVKQGKPDPEPYILAAKKLGLKPGECLVLEDSEAGVKSAKAAGMKCVGVRGAAGEQQNLSDADLIVSSLEDIDADVLREV